MGCGVVFFLVIIFDFLYADDLDLDLDLDVALDLDLDTRSRDTPFVTLL